MAIENKYVQMGQRIRDARHQQKISREDFALMTELSLFFVGQIERGQTKMSINTLIKVSDCLGLSLDYIVKGKITEADIGLTKVLNEASADEVKAIEEFLKSSLELLKKTYKDTDETI